MASFNRVLLLGNLGRDPELRFTNNQTPVATLNVATTDSRMVDGQRQEQTEWHRVIVWGKQAENCKRYLTKGRSVLVEGRLQTRSWDDKTTGQKRFSTEVIAQTVRFVGGGAGAQRSDSSMGMGGQDQYQDSQDFSDVGGMGGSQYGEPDTPSMDEIPF